MKNVKLLLIALVAFMAFSCASTSFQSQLRQVSVGMSKNEVVSKLGKNYGTIYSALAPGAGKVEIIRYTSMTGTTYEFEFLDDTLVRYAQLVDTPECQDHHHGPGHKHPRP